MERSLAIIKKLRSNSPTKTGDYGGSEAGVFTARGGTMKVKLVLPKRLRQH